MAYVHSKELGRWIGLSADTKPLQQPIGELLEELDTGAVYISKGDDTWTWREATKELDHNRAMLGLGLSYQTHLEVDIPQNNNLVLRFQPHGNYHHAEARIFKVFNSTCRLGIYRNWNTGLLPSIVGTLPNVNQKGLYLNGASLVYTNHGVVNDTDFAALIAGSDEVDMDKIYAQSTNQSKDSADSPVISGRHYTPEVDYLIVIENIGNDDAEIFYKYAWHEA